VRGIGSGFVEKLTDRAKKEANKNSKTELTGVVISFLFIAISRSARHSRIAPGSLARSSKAR
jgi:hypothetical protein